MMQRVTHDLMNDHQNILRLVSLLDQFTEPRSFRYKDLIETIEGIRLFIDIFHHEKEEKVVFPLLACYHIPLLNGSVNLLQSEHELGRSMISRILTNAAKLSSPTGVLPQIIKTDLADYLAFIHRHIKKEDTLFFPLVDEALSEPDDQEANNLLNKINLAFKHKLTFL